MKTGMFFSVILPAAIILSGCGGNSGVRGETAGEKTAAVAPATDAPTLAVVRLREQQVTPEEAAMVTDLVREAIARGGKYRVIEREQMERMMAEKSVAMAEMTSDSAEAGVAKMLNARFMGVGSLGKVMGSYVLSFRVVDVETGLLRGAGSADGETIDQIKKGIARMASTL